MSDDDYDDRRRDKFRTERGDERRGDRRGDRYDDDFKACFSSSPIEISCDVSTFLASKIIGPFMFNHNSQKSFFGLLILNEFPNGFLQHTL